MAGTLSIKREQWGKYFLVYDDGTMEVELSFDLNGLATLHKSVGEVLANEFSENYVNDSKGEEDD